MKKWMGLLLITAVLCLCFGAALAEDGLKPGDSGEAVLELNTRLRQLNYTTVRATDQYADATKAAVSAVQEAYGLEKTGIADERTLEIIYGDCYRPLTHGATGEDVKALQEKMAELGYYSGNITGSYLEGTEAAVKILQGENSMEITGIADVATQEKLFSLSIRPTATPTPVPTPSPIPTPSPTPGPYQPFPGTLKKGSAGSNVPKVQQRLMDLGFFTFYKTTNNYQDKTVQAVKDFQKHNGLEVTGVVNEDTWNALFNDTTTVDVHSAAKPAFEPTPLPYFFEVDVKNQVVKVWKYNRETEDYTDLDRAFICATGTTKYPSPLGTFTLSGRRAAHCKFPTWGGGEARWWTKITDEIAFHSVLYGDSSDASTLKVSSLTGLGRRGSHGCIRLTVADAKWIYDNATAGMKVWIHDDAADDPEMRYKVKPGELNTKSMMPVETPAPPLYTYDGKTAPETAERNLKSGDEGQDVYWLQMKLKELGFYTGTATGQYREGTKKAVAAYQRSRGLDSSGTANKKTLETLYKEVREANKTPEPTLAPTPTPAPTQTLVPDTQTPKP
ncbi:MAG: peptidoglycan-binding protein [Clostridia bacterium]|nr:peptidoglycan-binding protein [Clostridia bacterium]